MREQAKVYATLALLIMGILIFNILSPKGAANAGHHAEAILKPNGFALCIPISSHKSTSFHSSVFHNNFILNKSKKGI